MSKDNNGTAKQIDIGTPYNAKHITHVGFDAKSGQFTGLPPDWQILLKYSGITETEQMKHPQVSSRGEERSFCILSLHFTIRISDLWSPGCH
jgi:P21-Rho-binding domain